MIYIFVKYILTHLAGVFGSFEEKKIFDWVQNKWINKICIKKRIC